MPKKTEVAETLKRMEQETEDIRNGLMEAVDKYLNCRGTGECKTCVIGHKNLFINTDYISTQDAICDVLEAVGEQFAGILKHEEKFRAFLRRHGDSSRAKIVVGYTWYLPSPSDRKREASLQRHRRNSHGANPKTRKPRKELNSHGKKEKEQEG